MNFSKSFRNTFLVILLSLIISACATKKTTTKIDGQMQSDVYTGTDTVKYLAEGVPDRVFFATNESILTTASRDTLRKQANWLRENSRSRIGKRNNIFWTLGLVGFEGRSRRLGTRCRCCNDFCT